MDLKALRYVEAIARLGGFTKASAELNIAQPALSIAVGKLEAELGVRLFSRQPRHVSLTTEGALLLRRAQRVLQEIDTLKQEMGETAGLKRGHLRIGLPPMYGLDYFPNLLAGFHAKFPGIKVTAHANSASETRRQIEDGLVDLGLLESRLVDPHWRSAEVGREEIVLCVSRDHPLAGHRSIKGHELDGLAMAIFDKGFIQRGLLDERCAAAGAQPDPVLETNLVPLISKAISSGLGAGTLMRSLAAKDPNLVAIPFSPVETFRFFLCWADDQLLSKASRAFIDHAREFHASRSAPASPHVRRKRPAPPKGRRRR